MPTTRAITTTQLSACPATFSPMLKGATLSHHHAGPLSGPHATLSRQDSGAGEEQPSADYPVLFSRREAKPGRWLVPPGACDANRPPRRYPPGSVRCGAALKSRAIQRSTMDCAVDDKRCGGDHDLPTLLSGIRFQPSGVW